MTFKDKMHAAGFKTNADFGKYVGRTREIVGGWGDNPPVWAIIIVDLILKPMADTQALAEKYSVRCVGDLAPKPELWGGLRGPKPYEAQSFKDFK